MGSKVKVCCRAKHTKILESQWKRKYALPKNCDCNENCKFSQNYREVSLRCQA